MKKIKKKLFLIEEFIDNSLNFWNDHKIKNLDPYICKSYMKNDYFMYILKINYDKNLPYQFIKYRNLLQLSKTSYKYMEKDSISWQTIDEIKTNSKKYRCVFYKSFIDNIDNILSSILNA